MLDLNLWNYSFYVRCESEIESENCIFLNVNVTFCE